MNPDFTASGGRDEDVRPGDVVVTAAAPPSSDAAVAGIHNADKRTNCLHHLRTGPQEWPAARAPEPAVPVWDPATAYAMGERVSHDGAVFEASWSTRDHAPCASAHGPWQEIATSTDGTAVWTRSRIFEPGDVAVHRGATYVAQWWTRDQAPGDPHGPWRPQR